MDRILRWRRGFFKSAYEFTSTDGLPAGRLKENYWRNTADGELDGEKYHFMMKGFWQRNAEIIDPLTGTLVLIISFNPWRSGAVIEFTNDPGKAFTWSFDNFWHTKWNISRGSETMISYYGSQMRGEIMISLNDQLLILAGLFIAGQYWQMSAAAATV